MDIQEFADMVNNQIGKHGSYGVDKSVEEAVNSLNNWELLCLIKGECPYSYESKLDGDDHEVKEDE